MSASFSAVISCIRTNVYVKIKKHFLNLSQNPILVTLACGSSTTQNCSYFDSAGSPNSGSCTINVCKTSNDVCQVCNL